MVPLALFDQQTLINSEQSDQGKNDQYGAYDIGAGLATGCNAGERHGDCQYNWRDNRRYEECRRIAESGLEAVFTPVDEPVPRIDQTYQCGYGKCYCGNVCHESKQ